MRNLIIALTLMASLALVPIALARDANRDALQRIWHEEQMQQKRWEAIQKAKTPTERQQAFQTYIQNSPRLWEPLP
jgi:hypothetical protein